MTTLPIDNLTMSRQAGLTLVELVITLVVAAILATIAVPSFRAHVQNTRVATLTNDVVALVHDARSEAITRGAPVVVCASPDGIDCHGSWKDGWMAFVDLDNSGTRDIDKAKKGDVCDPAIQECVVRHTRVQPGGALPSNVIDDLSFAFLPNGFLNGAAATFHLCIDGVSAGRQLTIQASGQLVVEALDC